MAWCPTLSFSTLLVLMSQPHESMSPKPRNGHSGGRASGSDMGATDAAEAAPTIASIMNMANRMTAESL
jgi:hypothetical protein